MITSSPPSAWSALGAWSARRWAAALVAAIAIAIAIGVVTAVIPNPVFARPIEPPWWSVPALVVTAVLGGLVLATYVRAPAPPGAHDPVARRAGIGSVLGFLAVGCPVCNKLVVVALGTSGALSVFAPLQPLLAVAGLVLLGVALRSRLRGELACATAVALGRR